MNTELLDSVPEDFELFDEIGHGGYGYVYKAYDHRTQQDVALKMIKLTEE